MKGTIDATLPEAEKRLLDSDKERQEHYTIVDLMRNDLATVAENVEVTRFRYVEKIQTQKGAILQTSSEISGDLADNWQARIGTMLATLLPAGSISGAPKEKLCKLFTPQNSSHAVITQVFLVCSIVSRYKVRWQFVLLRKLARN